MALKVLLADDNITAQRMGCKILSDAGYTVVAVSNGAAAVKKIASEKPELIILDVFMPGYTGLEVCEKVKSAAETARVPVLLTVTSMEPYSAEDGNRVKADGVLIKPFEATDLLAVVRKLEEKLHLAEPAGVETTTKMEAVPDFSDPSYAEWKAEAGPDEPAARAAEMSHEVASAPVLGIEGLAPGSDAASTFAVESAPGPFAVESQPAEVPIFDLGAPAPAFDLQHAEPHDAAPVIAPPAELEYTSAPQAGPAEVAPAAEFEPTMQAGAEEVPVVQESALATDPSDFMQFATRFGQEHPEEIPVGIAMEEPPHDDALAPVSEFVAESGQEHPEEMSLNPASDHPEEIPVGIAMEEPPHDDALAPVSEFVAESGQEHPEEIPVGIAMEEPPHDDALAEIHEFVAESGQVVEPASFEQEMRQAFETSSGSAAAVCARARTGAGC